jgi:hypothetical protein
MNATNEIRNNNFINVLPNTAYYFLKPSNFEAYRYFFYDENKTFLSSNSSSSSSVLTTPLNCYYINFHYYGSVTYNNNISINISDASKNGTYEPYSLTTVSIPQLPAFRFHADPDGVITNVTAESWSDITKENIVRSLKDPSTGEQLFPYGLLTAGSVSDEVTPTYAIKRVGCVDLGTLIWTKYLYQSYFYANLYGNVLTAKKLSRNIWKTGGPEFFDPPIDDAPHVQIRYGEYSNYTAEQFREAMSGIYCGYELDTPITINFTQNLYNNIPPLLSAPLDVTLQTLNV